MNDNQRLKKRNERLRKQIADLERILEQFEQFNRQIEDYRHNRIADFFEHNVTSIYEMESNK
jgi:hypothetical protein